MKKENIVKKMKNDVGPMEWGKKTPEQKKKWLEIDRSHKHNFGLKPKVAGSVNHGFHRVCTSCGKTSKMTKYKMSF